MKITINEPVYNHVEMIELLRTIADDIEAGYWRGQQKDWKLENDDEI